MHRDLQNRSMTARLLDHWRGRIDHLLAVRDRRELDAVARTIAEHVEVLDGSERRRCNELHLRAQAGVRWLRRGRLRG